MKTLLASIGVISILFVTFMSGMFVMFDLILTDTEVQMIMNYSIKEYNLEIEKNKSQLHVYNKCNVSKFGIVYK